MLSFAKIGHHPNMRNINEIRKNNLRLLIKEKGSIELLAHDCETSPSYISQILTGVPSRTGKPRNVGDKLASKLEVGCQKPHSWLDMPHTEDGQDDLNYAVRTKLGYANPDDYLEEVTRGGIPLIEFMDALGFYETKNPVLPKNVRKWFPRPEKAGPRSYALEIKDDSMTNPYPGELSLTKGMIVWADPDKQYTAGSIVVIKLKGTDEPFLKKLTMNAGIMYMESLNTKYPVRELTDDAQIIATLFFAGWDI